MKKVLTRNIALKIISFLIAVLCWVMIMNISDPYIISTIDDIEVQTINTETMEQHNKRYDVESGDIISIKVRGKRSIIDGLKNTDFIAVADFNEMSMVNAVPIHVSPKESYKYNADEIEILEQTQMMTLTLEELDTQTFRVNVRQTGEAKEGYYVTELIANPNIIEISGSKKKIAKIKDVVVEINVDQASSSYQVMSNLIVYDENGYIIDTEKLDFETKEVTVDITVLPTKTIPIQVSPIGTPAYGYKCTDVVWEPKNITIAGEQKDLDKIYWLKQQIDISGKKETFPEKRNIETILEDAYPGVYTLVDESNTFDITVKIDRLESKDLSVRMSDIQVKNLDSDYEVIFKTLGNINVRVMGVSESLSEVSALTIRPYIDLLNYGLGTHSVTVQYKANDQLTIQPVTVSVEVVERE